MSRPKAASERQGHRTKKKELVVVPSIEAIEVPPAPELVVEEGSEAVELWETIWRVGGEHFAASWDFEVVEQYVVGVLRRYRWIRRIQDDGDLVPGSTGQPVAHPLISQLHTLEKLLSTQRKELGRNPEARARLGMAVQKHKTAMDAFSEKWANRGEVTK